MTLHSIYSLHHLQQAVVVLAEPHLMVAAVEVEPVVPDHEQLLLVGSLRLEDRRLGMQPAL